MRWKIGTFIFFIIRSCKISKIIFLLHKYILGRIASKLEHFWKCMFESTSRRHENSEVNMYDIAANQLLWEVRSHSWISVGVFNAQRFHIHKATEWVHSSSTCRGPYRKWQSISRDEHKHRGKVYGQITLESICGALIIWGFAWITAIFMLILELVIHNKVRTAHSSPSIHSSITSLKINQCNSN